MEEHKVIEFEKRRDFGNKLNATFAFARENFKSLFKAILFIAGPPILVASLLGSSFINDLFSMTMGAAKNPTPDMFNYFLTANFWAQIISMFIFMVVSYVAIIATTNNYMILYAEKKTNQIELQEIWDRVRSTLGMYFVTTLLYGLLLILAYVVMIVPVAVMSATAPGLMIILVMAFFFALVYAMVASSLVFPIRSFERKGFFESLARSFNLVQGKWWSTFGLVFVLSFVAAVAGYVFSLPATIIRSVSMMHDVQESGSLDAPAGSSSATVFILNSLAYISQLLLYFLPTIGVVFQYFNLVELKESKGLISQIDTIGKPPAPPKEDEHY